ncbi:putative lipase atg15 [Lecanicillium sp. MT-2017a]|nr:putative lipase atg15 [Lecanicillium sp. MT-2017a]
MPSNTRRCPSKGRVTVALLLSFLAAGPMPQPVAASPSAEIAINPDVFLPPGPVLPNGPEAPKSAQHKFSLRHIFHHGTDLHPQLHRQLDVAHDESRVFLAAEDGYDEIDVATVSAKSRALTIQRLKDRRPSVVDPMVATARRHGTAAAMDASAWTMDDVPAPDVTDRDTVLAMAYIAADAYVENEDKPDWLEIGAPFNKSLDFGWESDGLRGHIWADEDNSTVVIGLKGTTPAVFDGDGTTTNDKVNDNLFFSCCCAQQGQWTWHKVCDCATGTYSCNNTCVKQSLHEEHRYYGAARELYSNVTALYPKSNIWLTGHSLGGAVTSLLALTYGLPAVTFEAVPEALAASRLGLPVPPGYMASAHQERSHTGTFHFGHTADPIYIGTCNGATASCSFAGYALETACHTGSECVYDVVADKGWRVGVGTHKIRAVISDVLLQYDNVPECATTPECRDCGPWKMYESNGTETTITTSSTTTRTRTRTSICKTPGWWGCLDKTTGTPTTTTTTTTTTSTCKTPGWFGCNDKTTTEVTTTKEPAPTTTCETPGRFWGCYDVTDTTTAPTPSITQPPVTPAPTTTQTVTVTTTTTSTPEKRKCLHRNWLGMCKEWSDGEGGDEEDESVPDEI